MNAIDNNEPADGASQKVYLGILAALEEGSLVPGQRLAEIEIATRFAVGRNAVREAIQRLAARGVIDVSRHRSAMIRKLTLDETMDVLDVARVMTCLLVRTAACRFESIIHLEPLHVAVDDLVASHKVHDTDAFSRARRHFYRTLLAIAQSAELERIFPAIGMHIVHSQFRPARLQDVRITDYRAISDSVKIGDATGADKAANSHADHVRELIFSTARF